MDKHTTDLLKLNKKILKLVSEFQALGIKFKAGTILDATYERLSLKLHHKHLKLENECKVLKDEIISELTDKISLSMEEEIFDL